MADTEFYGDDLLNDVEANCLFDFEDDDTLCEAGGKRKRVPTPAYDRPSSPRVSESSTEMDGENAAMTLQLLSLPNDNQPTPAAEGYPPQQSPLSLLPPVEYVLDKLGAWRTELQGKAAVDAMATAIVSVRPPDDLSLFYVYDLGLLARLHHAWLAGMPRVAPFYAVKCNPDPGLLATLAALGTGFDCASGAEIEAVLRLGVDAASRVIFANCCKFPRDLHLAAAHDIPTTFDSIDELHKIAYHAPSLRLVIRIRSDDASASSCLGNKYGAGMGEVEGLLAEARLLGLLVFGVSFHVGSGAQDPLAFAAAINKARVVFDMGTQMGFHMSLLDIGGGMSCHVDDGSGEVFFRGFPEAINRSLASMFPEPHVNVIAEPGRCFAQHIGTLATQIFGRRQRQVQDGQDQPSTEYWLSDGLYGAFNCILYDHVTATVSSPLWSPHVTDQQPGDPTVLEPSTLWGPTCDGLDCIHQSVSLPRMRVGDWLVFRSFGAYTIAGATDFNGIKVSKPYVTYIASQY